jgi:hypothetical protein
VTSFFVIALACILAVILHRHGYNQGRRDQLKSDREILNNLFRGRAASSTRQDNPFALRLDCCNPRHAVHMIEGHPLAPVSFNVGSVDKNIAEAERNGWRYTSGGWHCPVCASHHVDK